MVQGNLGWALMQQNNYVEAEEAYRRALLLAPDNNKMCNLGICLMKQGRISEAKENLRRVKPAVVDGPRGVDSHLKAYERAQQMLRDLESEMMNRSVDRVEQSKLFDAFLGSSAIWQPQPCKESRAAAGGGGFPAVSSSAKSLFGDENVNTANIAAANRLPPLSVDAPPFYSSKFAEGLKRSRSGDAAATLAAIEKEERKSLDKSGESWADFLPDSKDFEDAIMAAVLGGESGGGGAAVPKKVEKRLKVFQDITTSSLSPKAAASRC